MICPEVIRTQTESFHYHALSSKACIAVQLYTHHLVSREALVERRSRTDKLLQQRELLRTRLSKSNGVHGLCRMLNKMSLLQSPHAPRCDGLGSSDTCRGVFAPSYSRYGEATVAVVVR